MITEAVLCLSLVIYHEARGEPLICQLEAASTPIQRAKENKTSICWEVFKPKQFSGIENPKNRKRLPKGSEWDASIKIATFVLESNLNTSLFHADHFDLSGAPSPCGKYCKKVGSCGKQTFYSNRSPVPTTSRSKP